MWEVNFFKAKTMATGQFVMTKMPVHPGERHDWCVQRLRERHQQVLAHNSFPILNKPKSPKRKRKHRACVPLSKRCTGTVTEEKEKIKTPKHTSCSSTPPTKVKKRPNMLQLFMHSPSSKVPQVVSANPDDSVSRILKQYKRKNSLTSQRIYLSTAKGFKLCEALTLEDNGVCNDTNLYVKIVDSGLKGGADDKDSGNFDKASTAQSAGKPVKEWDRADVRRWASEVVNLNKKYIDAFFEEEVDGQTLMLYKKEDLCLDFHFKKGPLFKLLQHVQSLEPSAADVENVGEDKTQLPVDINQWTVNDVGGWLTSIRIDDKYVQMFRGEEVDGQVLKEFTPEKGLELIREFQFDLPKGPMRKILYCVQSILRVSQSASVGEQEIQIEKDLAETSDSMQVSSRMHEPSNIPETTQGTSSPETAETSDSMQVSSRMHEPSNIPETTQGTSSPETAETSDSMQVSSRMHEPSNIPETTQGTSSPETAETSDSMQVSSRMHEPSNIPETTQGTSSPETAETSDSMQVSSRMHEPSNIPETTQDTSSAKMNINGKSKKPSGKTKLAEQYIKLLTKRTSLNIVSTGTSEKDVSQYKTCVLRVLHGKWGKAQNLLEQQFCFLVLTAQEELQQEKMDLLWKQLQNKSKHLVGMLPQDKRGLFDLTARSSQTMVVRRCDKQLISLRKTALTQSPLMQKDLGIMSRHSLFVLLVDTSLLTTSQHSYLCHLDSEKSENVLFHIDKHSQFAASFDPASRDLKLHFKKEKHPTPVAPSLSSTPSECGDSDKVTEAKDSNQSSNIQVTEQVEPDTSKVELPDTGPLKSVSQSSVILDQVTPVGTDVNSSSTNLKDKNADGEMTEPVNPKTTSEASYEQTADRTNLQGESQSETQPMAKDVKHVGSESSARKTEHTSEVDNSTEAALNENEVNSNGWGASETAGSVSPSTDVLYQGPRLFDSEVENCTYSHMRVLEVIETGVKDLIQPAHEYKQFTTYAKYLKHERLWKFINETIRFASACMNDRTNGTIHFGIADSKIGHHKHGQIIGFEVDDKTEYEEELNKYIERCFETKEHIDIARKCVRPPRFVPVFRHGMKKHKYVIEVDIIPHGAHCGSNVFRVKLLKEPPKLKYRKTDFEQETLYRRSGSTSSKMKPEDMHDYFQKHLNGLVERRNQAELPVSEHLPSTPSSVRRDNLAQKLTWLLCTGQTQLDSSFYPILVVNRPMSKYSLPLQMRFIREIDWVAVFDFDAESQTSGVCQMYSEQKIPHIQDPDMYLNISDVGAYRDAIGFPEKTCWIFCNGRADIGHKTLDRVQWNMDSSRSRGVKEAIRFFGNAEVIPKGRAIVVFLILSQDYEVMLEVFSEFSTYFTTDRLMCIADDENYFHGWAKGIVGRSCTMDVLQKRSVVGMPISHVNETILHMKGVPRDGQCTLPSSTGANVVLKQRDKNMLSDLEILSVNECDEEMKIMNYRQSADFLGNKELSFYRGNPVDWWNFWANDNAVGHVLKRAKHDELKKHVQDALSPETREEMKKVATVLLYHQPGAGGTTLTKYILWEFRKSYRCCVIKRVTKDTANQILRLWSYSEHPSQECKPVLAAVEKLDEAVFIALRRKIEEAWIKKGLANSGNKPLCVLLHCKSYIADHVSKEIQPQFESVTLDHALTDHERRWFARKLDELEKKAKDVEEFEPRHLLSFMILKENFSRDYIKSSVSGILDEVTKGSPEQQLLKYVALLNEYHQDSSLPVPCCEKLMGIGHYGHKRRENQHIEFLLSPPTKLLLLEMQKITVGSIKAFKIVHPLVAEEVLEQIMIQEQQDLADVTLEYLRSELFKTNSHAKEDLGLMTSEMLRRRKKYEYGDEYETKFSPLIMDIMKVEKEDEATQVLLQGMELFEDDAMMTQQVARMYLYKKKFEEAKQFAKKAVEMKPENSFLLDTLAEVYKEHMNSDYLPVKIEQRQITPDKAITAIQLGFRAMEVCQRSQKASLREKYSQNTSGYIKEVETCFRLMEILLCVEPFNKQQSGLQCLHDYLVMDDFRPANIAMPWAAYHRQFKTLHRDIQKAIHWLTNYCTFYREEYFDGDSPMKKLTMKLYDFSHQYVHYFGEDATEPPEEDKEPENINEWRRRRVSTLGCNRFRNIFNMVQNARSQKGDLAQQVLHKFMESKKLLQENRPMHEFDLHNLISLNLAISSIEPSQSGVSPQGQVYDMTKVYTQMMQGESLYPYFFQSMLMWPREHIQPGITYDPNVLHESLRELKRVFSSQEKRRSDESQIEKYRRRPIAHFRAKPPTVFFLGKGKGLRAFIHASELHYGTGEKFWKSAQVRRRLKRLKGVAWSQNVIRAYDMTDSNKATIEILTSIPFESVPSRDTVSFYLGFSWTGPVAYDISRCIDDNDSDDQGPLTEDAPDTEERTVIQQPMKSSFDYHQYRQKHARLQKTLQKINELKKKKSSGKKLEKNQLEKLAKEDELRDSLSKLEQEYRENMESNPDFLQDYY